ncbi:ABC transporter permease [Pelagicoccus enzymogenes]|uniref:ABC transporter permease n=1 Tax=Pelagicoccus enzymogenes TaxID=2773457 RepID=UPI00280F9695|nr:ABC transporter permease [Pelagicoccus enzymogenes]MDQ8200495.1 ABC transporter permease [Pelagicoccus enzymogenes]
MNRATRGGFEEEMRFHIEMETEKYVAEGMDPQVARRRAVLAFGNGNAVREELREELGWSWFGDCWRDLCFGMRMLGRRPGFAASVLVTLALCLGANMAFFASLQEMVLRDLPFEEPDRLVEIYRSEGGDGSSKRGGNLSLKNEYAAQGDLFEQVAFFGGKWSNLQIGGNGFRGNALRVSDTFFQTLGVSVERGEALGAATPDGSAWLARSLWESAYAADESVLGKVVQVDGRPYRILGIAPEEAERVAPEVSLFLKVDRAATLADPFDEGLRSESAGVVWARLADGVSVEKAASRLVSLERQFQERASSLYRESNDWERLAWEVVPVQEVRSSWASSRLLLLNAGALLVLLIGCVNVANLLLAQANARSEEYWMRRVLGARGGRLVRQCVAETVLLVGLSWLAALGIAMAGIQFLAGYSSELFRESGTVSLGVEAVAYGAGLAFVCMLALGVLVGQRAVAASKQAENARSGQQTTPGRRAKVLGSGLAVWQTAFTLALLIGGGLLVKSFYLVTNQDYGFETNGVVTGRIHLTDMKYEEGERKEAFKAQLLQRLEASVEVESVSLSSTIPTFGFPDQLVVKRDAADGEKPQRTFVSYVSEGHLKTLGISLLEGRDFLDTDSFGWQTPVLVDERFARLLYPGESALGKRLNLGRRPRNQNNWPVVVGVVESVKQTALDGDDGMPMLYLPLKGSWVDEFSVFVKTQGSEIAALKLLGSEVSRLDAGMPIYRSGSLDAVIAQSLSGRRGLLWLCMGLGLVALVLSAVGVYGASSFRVSQRLREFAIRMAVGATEGRVVAEHVGQDLRLAAVGLGLGVLLASQASRLLSAWLYEVEPFDWQTYAVLTLGLGLVYAASSYLPGRRGVKANKVRL